MGVAGAVPATTHATDEAQLQQRFSGLADTPLSPCRRRSSRHLVGDNGKGLSPRDTRVMRLLKHEPQQRGIGTFRVAGEALDVDAQHDVRSLRRMEVPAFDLIPPDTAANLFNFGRRQLSFTIVVRPRGHDIEEILDAVAPICLTQSIVENSLVTLALLHPSLRGCAASVGNGGSLAMSLHDPASNV